MDKIAKQDIGTYLLHNKETGHAYVGSGILRKRHNDHFWLLKNNEHYNPKLQNAFNKNPNFDFIPIVTDDREIARDLEQSIINEYHSNPLLLNISIDARYCNNGLPMSDEHKEKISQALKGRQPSPQAISAAIKAHKGIPLATETKEKLRLANLGKTLSDETRQKMSASRTGIPHSNEWNENIRQALKGKKPSDHTISAAIAANKNRIRSEEEIQKRSNTQKERMQNPEIKQKTIQALIGRPVSIETRKKLSESNRGQTRSVESVERARLNRQKPIIVNNKTYSFLDDAVEDLGISKSTLIRRLDSNDFPDYQRTKK